MCRSPRVGFEHHPSARTPKGAAQTPLTVQAGKVPPIPIERRPASEASTALSDLKNGGKVHGRVVLRHH